MNLWTIFLAGKVWYQSRFLRSESYKKNMAANRIVVSEFGTVAHPDPCKTWFQRLVLKCHNMHKFCEQHIMSWYFYWVTPTIDMHKDCTENLPYLILLSVEGERGDRGVGVRKGCTLKVLKLKHSKWTPHGKKDWLKVIIVLLKIISGGTKFSRGEIKVPLYILYQSAYLKISIHVSVCTEYLLCSSNCVIRLVRGLTTASSRSLQLATSWWWPPKVAMFIRLTRSLWTQLKGQVQWYIQYQEYIEKE